MHHMTPGDGSSSLAQDILGYLNFSSGTPDPRFLKNLDALFGQLATGRGKREPAWLALADTLRAGLQAVRGTSDAFRQVDQAEAVLGLVFDGLLPAYRQFHRDLLFHQTEETLFAPLFIGRACEAVLQQGGPWNQAERIVPAALRQLNDYIGHRPVAVLRTAQKIQPYEHEWVRPIPLWIRGVGASWGPYRELVETALALLDATDPALLFEATFVLEQLDELAFDPRAYDFDHPVNKRPNYLFGQWDMNRLDNAGRSRRFVLQQVTLDAMLDRLSRHGRLPHKQVLLEEAAVLAGTMLMGSGVSGNRPDAHDSTVTLATLVGKIAIYRDVFYESLLKKLTGAHAERLRAEAQALRQPFGGARQHFNHYLAQRRAQQLQHVHVAQLFAAIGYIEGATRQIAVVPTASARMSCDMRCHLAVAHLAVERGQLAEAAAELPRVESLLHAAIERGAMVDPWNILGFGGQYGLFPAIENSVHDHRVDELLDMVGAIFALYVRIDKAAAATGDTALQQTLTENMTALARWWDKFASVEVDTIDGISGQATVESAQHVAAALRAWHQGGAAAGDLGFWREHVEQFRSPKAYAMVIDTLLDRRDPVAAMALLVQWLGQAREIPLVEEDYSFHDLALGWMETLWQHETEAADAAAPPPAPPQRWPLARKFLDYLEANAEEYWQVPRFEMAAEILGDQEQPEEADGEAEGAAEAEDEEDDVFGAAYEDVTYRDSADDGVEGEMFETGQSATDFELVGEAERIVDRLNFLTTVAQLWKMTAMASVPADASDRDEVLAAWLAQAEGNSRRLLELLASVHRYRIPPPRGTQESLVEYDRRRSLKETLLEEIIEACVETGDAARMIRASMAQPPAVAETNPWECLAGQVLAAVLQGDVPGVRRAWPKLLELLDQQPLLYVALGRGGNPQRIVASRGLQYVLRRLLICLPRLGLLSEACRLLETAQRMEAGHPVGPGAITEFDRVFEIGCQAITQCLVVSSAAWGGKKKAAPPAAPRAPQPADTPAPAAFSRRADAQLIDCLEQVIEALLRCWLMHSHGVRLSVLETVSDPPRWRGLKQFIERYGGDLFTQRFMNLGNLRGILHQGVAEYLRTLAEDPDAEDECRLLRELGTAIAPEDAAQWLGTAIEAVVENYGEYVDYNSITTQSDRGDMLYTLLDFLRLRANYDRLAWNLRPVTLAHQVLTRCGREGAAEIWRRAVAERTSPIAEEHLRRFQRLCKKYGMRLPSIAEHLGERFIQPLEIDRLCALLRPAIDEIRSGRPPASLQQLEEHIARFTQRPPAPVSSCPVGWKPWSKRWSASSGRRPRRTPRRPIRSSVFPRSVSRGPRWKSKSRSYSAKLRSGCSATVNNLLPKCWGGSYTAIPVFAAVPAAAVQLPSQQSADRRASVATPFVPQGVPPSRAYFPSSRRSIARSNWKVPVGACRIQTKHARSVASAAVRYSSRAQVCCNRYSSVAASPLPLGTGLSRTSFFRTINCS